VAKSPTDILFTEGVVKTANSQSASVSNDCVRTYHVLLKIDEDGRHVVTCPSLSGVVTDGADEMEAILNAHEAVHAILESQGEDEEIILVSSYLNM